MSKSKKKSPPDNASVLDVPVEFGGLSIGDVTARIGVRIDREHMNIVAADECFTGKRLSVVVTLGSSEPDQKELFKGRQHEVTGSVDVKRLGVTSAQYSAGLTFNLESIDVATIAKFSKGKGRLKVFEVAALPDGHDEEKEEHGTDD